MILQLLPKLGCLFFQKHLLSVSICYVQYIKRTIYSFTESTRRAIETKMDRSAEDDNNKIRSLPTAQLSQMQSDILFSPFTVEQLKNKHYLDFQSIYSCIQCFVNSLRDGSKIRSCLEECDEYFQQPFFNKFAYQQSIKSILFDRKLNSIQISKITLFLFTNYETRQRIQKKCGSLDGKHFLNVESFTNFLIQETFLRTPMCKASLYWQLFIKKCFQQEYDPRRFLQTYKQELTCTNQDREEQFFQIKKIFHRKSAQIQYYCSFKSIQKIDFSPIQRYKDSKAYIQIRELFRKIKDESSLKSLKSFIIKALMGILLIQTSLYTEKISKLSKQLKINHFTHQNDGRYSFSLSFYTNEKQRLVSMAELQFLINNEIFESNYIVRGGYAYNVDNQTMMGSGAFGDVHPADCMMLHHASSQPICMDFYFIEKRVALKIIKHNQHEYDTGGFLIPREREIIILNTLMKIRRQIYLSEEEAKIQGTGNGTITGTEIKKYESFLDKNSKIVTMYQTFEAKRIIRIEKKNDGTKIRELLNASTFISLELCDISLASCFKQLPKDRQKSTKVIYRIATQLISVIQYIHHDISAFKNILKQQHSKQSNSIESYNSNVASLGIYHRDLKPQNIMIILNGSSLEQLRFQIKIIDWGMARIVNVNELKRGAPCGTVYYQSYQMLLDQPYNGKVDIWSFGMILLQLINKGQKIFNTQEIDDMKPKLQSIKEDIGKVFLPIYKNQSLDRWRVIVDNCLQIMQHKRWDAPQIISYMNINKQYLDGVDMKKVFAQFIKDNGKKQNQCKIMGFTYSQKNISSLNSPLDFSNATFKSIQLTEIQRQLQYESDIQIGQLLSHHFLKVCTPLQQWILVKALFLVLTPSIRQAITQSLTRSIKSMELATISNGPTKYLVIKVIYDDGKTTAKLTATGLMEYLDEWWQRSMRTTLKIYGNHHRIQLLIDNFMVYLYYDVPICFAANPNTHYCYGETIVDIKELGFNQMKSMLINTYNANQRGLYERIKGEMLKNMSKMPTFTKYDKFYIVAKWQPLLQEFHSSKSLLHKFCVLDDDCTLDIKVVQLFHFTIGKLKTKTHMTADVLQFYPSKKLETSLLLDMQSQQNCNAIKLHTNNLWMIFRKLMGKKKEKDLTNAINTMLKMPKCTWDTRTLSIMNVLYNIINEIRDQQNNPLNLREDPMNKMMGISDKRKAIIHTVLLVYTQWIDYEIDKKTLGQSNNENITNTQIPPNVILAIKLIFSNIVKTLHEYCKRVLKCSNLCQMLEPYLKSGRQFSGEQSVNKIVAKLEKQIHKEYYHQVFHVKVLEKYLMCIKWLKLPIFVKEMIQKSKNMAKQLLEYFEYERKTCLFLSFQTMIFEKLEDKQNRQQQRENLMQKMKTTSNLTEKKGKLKKSNEIIFNFTEKGETQKTETKSTFNSTKTETKFFNLTKTEQTQNTETKFTFNSTQTEETQKTKTKFTFNTKTEETQKTKTKFTFNTKTEQIQKTETKSTFNTKTEPKFTSNLTKTEETQNTETKSTSNLTETEETTTKENLQLSQEEEGGFTIKYWHQNILKQYDPYTEYYL